ncbi:MAG TPA: cytochrome c3 family protein, partial [Candidatus Xenobia bacterium]
KNLGPHLLRAGGEPGLCYTCHADVQAQGYWPSHHPLKEGEMSCSDCHNPHGSELSAWRGAPTSRDLCLKCHAQYRGPFAVEHPPAQEDCTICHSPHGSMNRDLLVASEPFLCQRCHADVHNPHVPASFRSSADLAQQALFFSDCTVCHGSIHGSDQSNTFTR